MVTEIGLLKSKKNTKSIQENLLWAYMYEFMKYGGYPAVVLENNIDDKIELLREIRDSYIIRDLFESGVSDETKFYRILMLLASQSGNLLNVIEISNMLRITNATVENYFMFCKKVFTLL